MPTEDLQDDLERVRNTRGVLQSVLVWVSESNNRLQAAVDAAMEKGATQDQLQPFLTEISETNAVAQQVAQAITANPSGGSQPPA